jgi:hypothetical protein
VDNCYNIWEIFYSSSCNSPFSSLKDSTKSPEKNGSSKAWKDVPFHRITLRTSRWSIMLRWMPATIGWEGMARNAWFSIYLFEMAFSAKFSLQRNQTEYMVSRIVKVKDRTPQGNFHTRVKGFYTENMRTFFEIYEPEFIKITSHTPSQCRQNRCNHCETWTKQSNKPEVKNGSGRTHAWWERMSEHNSRLYECCWILRWSRKYESTVDGWGTRRFRLCLSPPLGGCKRILLPWGVNSFLNIFRASVTGF